MDGLHYMLFEVQRGSYNCHMYSINNKYLIIGILIHLNKLIIANCWLDKLKNEEFYIMLF